MDADEFAERMMHQHNIERLVSHYGHIKSPEAIHRLYRRIVFGYREATVKKFVGLFAFRDAEKILSRRMRA